MKKVTYIYFAILLLVGSAAIFLLTQNRTGTNPNMMKVFAIADTQNVTKIFLADRANNRVLLERKGPNLWSLNKKYTAYKSRVDLILECIKNVEMKNPLSEKAKKAFLKDMLTGSIKVEIYTHGNDVPEKTYYVGGTTADQLGTIMLMEGSKDPMVTWIPGFEGYLSVRYEAVEKGWRSREVYKIAPSSIREVTYTYPGSTEESFTFKSDGKNFSISSAAHPEKSYTVSPSMAKDFLLGFANIEYEAFYTASIHEMDSVKNSSPLINISVKAEGQNIPSLKFFNVLAVGHNQMAGRDPFDRTRFLAIASDAPAEILYVQRRNIKRLMHGFKDFIEK